MVEKYGGKVIGAGGFGCVFFPALKCKKNNNKSIKFKGISKLSTKTEILKENKINNDIRYIIKKIPNYNNYFLINNIFTCEPKILTKNDMNGLEKCIILKKFNITKKNINKNLDKFDIINIPFGGIELFKVLDNSKFFIKHFLYFNKRLYNVIKFAIIPMNNLRLYHNDIKSNNLLIDLKNKLKGFQKFNPQFGRRLVKMGLKMVLIILLKLYLN